MTSRAQLPKALGMVRSITLVARVSLALNGTCPSGVFAPRAEDGQHRYGQHRQSNVPIPSLLSGQSG